MAYWSGFFRNRRPCLTFLLRGVECVAIIDTGFTGCVKVSKQFAAECGLTGDSTAKYVLANGSCVTYQAAVAEIGFGDQTLKGTILFGDELEDILVGMDFLRLFELTLIVTPRHVLLVDQDTFNQDAFDEAV
jgi:predicted aspartyl protease